MQIRKEFFLGIFICLHINLLNVNARPFFFNSSDLISSILGASSASAVSISALPKFEENPYSENIAIIPNTHQQSQKQEEENTNFVFPDEITTVTSDLNNVTTTTETSFIKKKINKIIQKILTIYQIKNAINNFNKEEDMTGFQYPKIDDFTTSRSTSPTFSKLSRSSITIKIPPENYQEYGAPLKFNLDTNNNEYSKRKIQRRNDIESEGNIDQIKPEFIEESNVANDSDKNIPAAFGIFVLEMFASLIGLTFGAVAQINHSFGQQNNNTAPQFL